MFTKPKAIRKKRSSSDATPSNIVSECDHRKRRRNRTTQSCINCHTSKRMCDRKRPCGRCTQLGLTGLCVYEVDDPSQRSAAQDESSRLRKRVAELESVIRELKNKPHPRWAKSGSSPGKEFDECYVRAPSRSASENSAVEPQHQSDPSQSSSKDPNIDLVKDSLEQQTASLFNETLTLQQDYLSPRFSPPSTGSSALSTFSYSPDFDIHSPPSAPSTGIVTPTEDHPQIQISTAGDQPLNSDIGTPSLFMTRPNVLGCDERGGQVNHMLRTNTHSQHINSHSIKYNHGQLLDGHCGCLNEASSYNLLLELSLCLRKAENILSHSTNHLFNNGCQLNQKIVDLNSFTTTALGNMTTSHDDFRPVHLRTRANTAPSGLLPPTFSTTSCITPLRVPVISPPTLHGLRSWNVARTLDLSASCDESFMTWEPSHRG